MFSVKKKEPRTEEPPTGMRRALAVTLGGAGFGGGDYAMRAWLDPDRIASHGLTAGDVVDSILSMWQEMAL